MDAELTPPVVLLEKSEYPYYSVVYTGGTECDLTGIHRTTTVMSIPPYLIQPDTDKNKILKIYLWWMLCEYLFEYSASGSIWQMILTQGKCDVLSLFLLPGIIGGSPKHFLSTFHFPWQIRYICHEAGRGDVYEIKETSTCEYTAIVLVSDLCQHPAYQWVTAPLTILV